MKTFPFGLFLMGHISVFQLNDPKSMNFFITSESLALAVVCLKSNMRVVLFLACVANICDVLSSLVPQYY